MPETHTILGGKVHVYRRENSSRWQCSTYFGGKNRRISTKEDSLSRAKEIAEDWYLELRGKLRSGELQKEAKRKKGKTFQEASKQFLTEFEQLTVGQRSPVYISGIRRRLGVNLRPFFGDLGVSENYRRQDSGIPCPSHETVDGKAEEAARAQHDASGNRYFAPGAEDRPAA